MITEKQRLNRQKYLCASDMPVILGLSPFLTTPGDIYWQKVASLPPDHPADFMGVGNLLENALLGWAAQELGVSIIRNQFRVAQDGKGKGLIAAHCDAIGMPEHDSEGIEAKYANAQFAQGYGEPYTDQVPDYIIVQVQAQMYAAGLNKVWVAAGLAGFSFTPKLFVVNRSEQIINKIVELGLAWWHKHVVAKVPPDDAAIPPIEILKAIERKEGSTVEITEKQSILIDDWNAAKKEAKLAEEKAEIYKAAVITLLGENEIGLLPDGRRITYKQTIQRRLDLDTLRIEQPEMAAKYMKEISSRRLYLKESKKSTLMKGVENGE